MRVLEVILPKYVNDRSLMQPHLDEIDMLRDKIQHYADVLGNPDITPKHRDFLSNKIIRIAREIKTHLKHVESYRQIHEATRKQPLSESDFDSVKIIFERPVPAVVAHIYITGLIDDDQLSQSIEHIADKDPSADVRNVIADWLSTNSPNLVSKYLSEPDFINQDGSRSSISGQPLFKF